MDSLLYNEILESSLLCNNDINYECVLFGFELIGYNNMWGRHVYIYIYIYNGTLE